MSNQNWKIKMNQEKKARQLLNLINQVILSVVEYNELRVMKINIDPDISSITYYIEDGETRTVSIPTPKLDS